MHADPEPSPSDRLNLVSQQGLCIGCGMCQDIAGPETVRCTLTANGYERPVIVGELNHETVDRIYEVCPGVRVTGATAEDGSHMDQVWGPWQRIDLAWAAEPTVRHVGSTGGVLTALGMYLLDAGEVDAVLHAGPSATVAGFGEARISRTPEEVLAATGSRYGPTAVFTRLEEALDTADRLAVIAKPCDLSALRLRARSDQRIGRQVLFTLTMVCGGIMAPEGLAERMDWYGIDPAEVTGIRYRGHGCPGNTLFFRGEEEPVEISYLDFWGEDESTWTIPYRCKICPDGTGEVADIAAADTWPGGTPTEAMLSDDPGTNAVIARTARGRRLMEEAADSGHIAIGSPATIEDLNRWQPHHVRKKQASWARQAGRRRARVLPIELIDLRAEEIAAARPVDEQQQEEQGSYRRALDGRADEPIPALPP